MAIDPLRRRSRRACALTLLAAALAGLAPFGAAPASSQESLSSPPAAAPALASAWAVTEQSRLRLLSAAAGTGEATELRLGLEFELEPGWKIYWRSPGAAGFPPRLDWAGSQNLAGVAMAWPRPTRFSVLGLD